MHACITMLADTESLIETVSGRVALCGEPRVGKSTLMNRARHRLLATPGGEDLQMGQPNNVIYGNKSNNIARLSYTAVPPPARESPYDGDANGSQLVTIDMCDLGDTLSASATSLLHSQSLNAHAQYQLDNLFSEKNILVALFDLTRRETFDACGDWILLWQKHAGRGAASHSAGVLVGTKSRSGYRTVFEHEALRFAAERSMTYLEIDARDSDDDVDLFVVYLARIAVRLYRYSVHMSLAGKRGCPPRCEENERLHRHVFRTGTTESHIEYITQEDLIRRTVEQPKPALQSNWVRVANMWGDQYDDDPPPYARHEPHRLAVIQINDPLANRLLPAEPPSANTPARVPTNVLTRPVSRAFDERTSLLTTLWGPSHSRCYVYYSPGGLLRWIGGHMFPCVSAGIE